MKNFQSEGSLPYGLVGVQELYDEREEDFTLCDLQGNKEIMQIKHSSKENMSHGARLIP